MGPPAVEPRPAGGVGDSGLCGAPSSGLEGARTLWLSDPEEATEQERA